MFNRNPMTACLSMALLCAFAIPSFAAQKWVVYEGTKGPGKGGPGKGKHIVLISGDDEYRSEEALPQLGKILAKHHGFKCTVLFAIDPKDGTIKPNYQKNIPGTEALKTADLMIVALRFRNLPDEQMKPIDDFLKAGKPVIGLRTSTHAFNIPKNKTYSHYHYTGNKKWSGGFGRQILGDTWLNHHGHHKHQSTRGLIVKGTEKHPIVQGCGDIWGTTDVYGVRLPMPKECKPLVLGQVLSGMKPTDKPVETKKNNPMMPIAWTKTYKIEGGKQGKSFTTTMGAATDLHSAGVRRMLVNACYWCTGMEDKISKDSKVDIVGEYKPNKYSFGGFKKGLKPADFEMKE